MKTTVHKQTPATIDVTELEALAKESTRNKAWTDEEIDILKRYHGKGGITARKLADVLGRTMNSVNYKITELGLRKLT